MNATPTLEFVPKASGITSITGEKLYETQVLGAVSPALAEHQLPSSFFIMLADVKAVPVFQRTANWVLPKRTTPTRPSRCRRCLVSVPPLRDDHYTPEPMARYNDWVQEGIAGVEPWHGGCNGYYRTPNGRIVPQWPHSMSAFKDQTSTINEAAYETVPLSKA